MNALEKLKRRLAKQEPSEQDQVHNLCAVMEICGGYEQLVNLPLPTLNHILKYLEFLDKMSKKDMSKMPHTRRLHR